MAKKAKKTKKATTKKAPAKKRAVVPASGGFKVMAMHVTEESGRRAFAALKADRPATSAFALADSQPENLDSETAAKRILAHALASDKMPSLTAPDIDGEDSDFKSLGVETVPLTGTRVVKFRQQVQGIPVFGSLVSVELDDNHELVSLNASMAQPNLASYVAKLSPLDALKKIANVAGYGRELPKGVPTLNLFFDHNGKWHLAYIVDDVRSRPKKLGGSKNKKEIPIVYDYVIDAMSGALVAELPRTPAMAEVTDTGLDELGHKRTFGIEIIDGKKAMRDARLNVETYDFRYHDPVGAARLPGKVAASPFSPAAVSAHANAAIVAAFLRDVLKRNNIDDMGGRVISTVNCVVEQFENPPGSKVWPNAFWDGKQMLYGQVPFHDQLRSMASSLNVVAHELFHGVTGGTARLIYLGQTGALNESYSDIFGTIIANSAEPDIAKWDWLIGDGLSSDHNAMRDMQDPNRCGQPKLMKDFQALPLKVDSGGVHLNSGIHNYAAFEVMTATDGHGFLFKPSELAAMFYVALTQQLSRQSSFADSRRGVVLATRSLFRKQPQHQIEARAAAAEAGFDAAGIK